MNRRGFLAGALAGMGGFAVQAPDSTEQGRGQAPAGDPLFNPSAVQERPAATAADNDAMIQRLERRLKCTCPCNLDIYTCRTTDFTCSYSPALHREVLDLRRGGKGEAEIVEAFLAKYGERILMAPEPKGFNLTGYLVPGIALLTAGGLLAGVLLRRSRMVSREAGHSIADPDMVTEAGPESGPAAVLPPEDAERLRQALAEVED